MLRRPELESALEIVRQRSALFSQTSWDNAGLGPIHLFERLQSTNQTLWQLIAQGAGPGTVAIAAEQDTGRGQWGRTWVSRPGGLYLSLALAPDLLAANGAQLTLAVAWGIAMAFRHWQIPVQLKWPNDLVLSGHKLGGILTETRVRQHKIVTAVIGVGINWANPVPAPGINLTTFLAHQSTDSSKLMRKLEWKSTSEGGELQLSDRSSDEENAIAPAIDSLAMVAALTLEGCLSGYHRWQQEGIESLLADYQALLSNIGQPVQVKTGSGIVVGVSATGELLVRLTATSPAATLDRSGRRPLPANEHTTATPEIALKPGMIRLGYPAQPLS